MNSNIHTGEYSAIFRDSEVARTYLESRRWSRRQVCPHCDSNNNIVARKGKRRGYYQCKDCGNEFTVRTGTILERSHVPLHKWILAVHLALDNNRVTSSQLARDLEVTRKTARSMLGRISEVLGGGSS